jgi:glycosyltransferase involved in cell wall biosynthesis
LKAQFFLLDGESNASSQHRVLQYFPYLRARGIEPVASRPVPEPIYQRLVEQRRGGSAKAAFYLLFLCKRALDVWGANRADVVVIQRDLFPFGPPLLERWLASRNLHVVYDTDDATYLRPAFTPNSPFQRLRRFDKVAEVISAARWVSVATQPIADWAGRYNANVSVVPMAVDLAAYDRLRRPARGGGPFVVGWAGTAGGLRYLETLAPVLRQIAARHDVVVRVISGGYRQVCLPGVPLDARPWRAATALEDLSTFDIGLVPLDDTPFEHAKFPFKLLQYLALGVPAVSARVGLATSVLRHAENGLLVNSPEQWRGAIEALIGDPQLRRRLAAAGRETVAAHYTIERVAPLFADGLLRAAA